MSVPSRRERRRDDLPWTLLEMMRWAIAEHHGEAPPWAAVRHQVAGALEALDARNRRYAAGLIVEHEHEDRRLVARARRLLARKQRP